MIPEGCYKKKAVVWVGGRLRHSCYIESSVRKAKPTLGLQTGHKGLFHFEQVHEKVGAAASALMVQEKPNQLFPASLFSTFSLSQKAQSYPTS